MRRFLIVFCLLLINRVGYANELFQKKAIQIIAQSLSISKDPSSLKDRMEEDPANYLEFAIELYSHNTSIAYPDYLDYLGTSELLGNMSMTINNFQVMSYSNGEISINGVRQKAHILRISELENAVNNEHWFTVRNSIVDIALAAEKTLISSHDEKKIQQAKGYATSYTVPSHLRTQLLGAFVDFEGFGFEDWLLQQTEFKDSARDKLVVKLINKDLSNNKPEQAEDRIRQFLKRGYSAHDESAKQVFHYYFKHDDISNAERTILDFFTKGYSAYEEPAKTLFNYYFSKEQFASAERILNRHFSKGYTAYEDLAKVFFNYYLKKKDFGSAEQVISRHFQKGYTSSDNLVKILVDHMIQNQNFEEATRVADHNMSHGYTSHTQLTKYILEQEVAYLRSLKR